MQNVTGWSGSTPNKRQEKWKNNREEWRSVGPPLLALGKLPAWLKVTLLPPYLHKRWTLPAVRNADSSNNNNNNPLRHTRNNPHLDHNNLLSRTGSHEPPPRSSNKPPFNTPAGQKAVVLAGRCQVHR